MRIIKVILYMVCFVITFTAISWAGELKVYVKPFTVVGADASKSDNQAIMQALLTAKLADGDVLPVVSEAEADVIAQGTYITLANQYSLDVVILDPTKKALARKVIQGTDAHPSMFSLIGVIAKELKPELIKASGKVNSVNKSRNDSRAADVVPRQMVSKDIVINRSASEGYSGAVVIPRLQGSFNCVRMMKGESAFVLADSRSLKIISATDKKVVADSILPIGSQIINIDVISAKTDYADILVTYVALNKVYTDVYHFDGIKMTPIITKEPYFTKIIKIQGKDKRLFVQDQGDESNRYFGPVYEAKWNGKQIVRGRVFMLPDNVSLYRFNQFTDKAGAVMTVTYDDNDYVAVYDSNFEKIWKSNDKFGGSELSYSIRDLSYINKTGKEYRTYFMNQKIEVTPAQSVLIGSNDGSFVLGDSRSYKKGLVYNFVWNGSALEESWRTKETQSYMPDFEYADDAKQLYQLQLVSRENPFKTDTGVSSLIVKKVE